MSDTAGNTLRFQAITFGVDQDTDSVVVGFEMDRRPGHDSRGLILSRATSKHDHGDSEVYVEFGEPQQHCMYGGIEKVRSTRGNLRIQFTDVGAKEMTGLRAIEVDCDEAAKVVPELLAALDYIFEGFGGYNRDAEPG